MSKEVSFNISGKINITRDELSKRKNLGANDINIKNDVDLKIGSSKYSVKERKPIKVNPPTLETIRNISYAKDIPNV